MRILMTCGGTAGHVNPAIAIADTIKEKEPNAIIQFVCSSNKGDKAKDLVPRANYSAPLTVDICGRYQLWNPKNIKTLYLMLKSRSQARKIIEDFKPDIIIGTGGYACYPLLTVGAQMGIPTCVHESNAIPGKAVKRLASKIDCVMTNFDASDILKNAKKLVRTGNPNIIKKETKAVAIKDDESDYKSSVLIFGGSLGAPALNSECAKALINIAAKYPSVEFIHGCGKRDHERMSKEYSELGLDVQANVKLLDYIYDMNEKMAKADIVISRAGAMTLSELALLGKAAILVPSPNVADQHQYKNAKALFDKDACILIEEKQYGTGALEKAITLLLTDKSKRESLQKNIVGFANPCSNETIYNEIKRLIK